MKLPDAPVVLFFLTLLAGAVILWPKMAMGLSRVLSYHSLHLSVLYWHVSNGVKAYLNIKP